MYRIFEANPYVDDCKFFTRDRRLAEDYTTLNTRHFECSDDVDVEFFFDEVDDDEDVLVSTSTSVICEDTPELTIEDMCVALVLSSNLNFVDIDGLSIEVRKLELTHLIMMSDSYSDEMCRPSEEICVISYKDYINNRENLISIIEREWDLYSNLGLTSKELLETLRVVGGR